MIPAGRFKGLVCISKLLWRLSKPFLTFDLSAGQRRPAEEPLRGPEGQTLLSCAGQVHELWSCGCHGERLSARFKLTCWAEKLPLVLNGSFSVNYNQSCGAHLVLSCTREFEKEQIFPGGG